MDWTATRPNIEIAAEYSAAIMLGAAVALALALLVPGVFIAAASGGAGAAAAAIAVQRAVAHGVGGQLAGFTPVDWPGAADGEEQVLLLDEPFGPCVDEALLLEDAVAPPAPSRVVRLFGDAPARDAAAGGGAAIPAPGDMLARIETFLGAQREAPAAAFAASQSAASAEASAALHAALADIRRSLRQG